MECSRWITATIDIDRSTEFTNDDVDRFTDLIDLGKDYEYLLVVFGSAITSAVLTPYVQLTGEVDENPVPMYILDDDATGSFAHATTAGTTQLAIIFRIGAVQYLRLYAGANQAADETFYVRGFNS